jgi:plasmid stability protein
MAQLLVRGLSEETVRLLRERAKGHRRSVEAEHRAILEEAVAAPTITTEEWAERLSGTVLAELDARELRGDEPPRNFDWPE